MVSGKTRTLSVSDYKMFKMGISWYSTVGLSLVHAGKLASCLYLPLF